MILKGSLHILHINVCLQAASSILLFFCRCSSTPEEHKGYCNVLNWWSYPLMILLSIKMMVGDGFNLHAWNIRPTLHIGSSILRSMFQQVFNDLCIYVLQCLLFTFPSP